MICDRSLQGQSEENQDMLHMEASFSSMEEAPTQSTLPATRHATLPPGWMDCLSGHC